MDAATNGRIHLRGALKTSMDEQHLSRKALMVADRQWAAQYGREGGLMVTTRRCSFRLVSALS
jgi:hypothetical protein